VIIYFGIPESFFVIVDVFQDIVKMGSSDGPSESRQDTATAKCEDSSVQSRRNSLTETKEITECTSPSITVENTSATTSVSPDPSTTSSSRYSSNSSIDSTQYLSPTSKVEVAPYIYHQDSRSSYTNKIPTIHSRAGPPAIAPDLVASNIQKNIEHCKRQQLQQIENVIREFLNRLSNECGGVRV